MKIGLVSGLFLLLLALKLCGVIHWSWWLVLMPLWLPVAALGELCCCGLVLLPLWQQSAAEGHTEGQDATHQRRWRAVVSLDFHQKTY